DGFSVECGHKLLDVVAEPDRPSVAQLKVDLDLAAPTVEAPEDFKEWLDDVAGATSTALDSITGTAFALQRVTRISVEVDSVTLAEVDGAVVPYQVYAEWPGGEDRTPNSQIMSQDTIDGMETDLLQSLTGGVGLDGVAIEACNQTQKAGVRILAQQPTDSCQIRVRVGVLDSGETTFAIRMRG
ncbi:MAG: hypothetical protein LBU05_00085, partial [Bifidobacteriaceae bacterium]|nr:hypothetical protein [Bifidobacteriaceae bacterium]